MGRLARSPPVVGLALAAGAGALLLLQGVSLSSTLPPLLTVLLLKQLFHRPGKPSAAFALAFLAGAVFAQDWENHSRRDCRFQLRDGQDLVLSGRMVGPLAEGRGEFLPAGPERGPCGRALRIVAVNPAMDEPEPGRLLTVKGTWRVSRALGSVPPLRAGYLRVDSLGLLPPGNKIPAREALVVLGGWVQDRLRRLFPRVAPVAVALVWARKDELKPEVREDFARAGVAHLLAISGFHVGVVGGVLLLLLGCLGLPHAVRFLLASLGVWSYVLALGLPDAAVRAALLLSILALGRVGNRAVAPLGALATAFLGFVAFDSGALLRPGFQLSFAGATGLVLGYRPLLRWWSDLGRGRVPAVLCQGIAAGTAATLATLPLVAWHFGRVSLVGIPLTLLATPLVALAIPGIFASLLLSLIDQGAAGFLASGVEVVLELLLGIVRLAASIPFASVWVARGTVLVALASLGLAFAYLWVRPRRGKGTRTRFTGTMMIAGILLAPPILRQLNRGVLELVVLDVGQGDAILLRSPGGRWMLVDAGPRTRTFDAGARTVLPYMRRRGVESLELLVLTHPDMDHVGGAAAILEDFSVGAVVDPGMAVGTGVFLGALETAEARGVPWHVLLAGDSLELDGMAIRVVAPEPTGGETRGEAEEEGANGASLVLEVRFGAFSALLSGDAPAASELRFLPRLLSHRFQILKVGHHGSSTSTTQELLDRTHPATALISAGRGNHFGHPHQGVLDRLRDAGVRIFRTDQAGALVLRARRNGSYRVSTEYP